jgi:hypothetical protein
MGQSPKIKGIPFSYTKILSVLSCPLCEHFRALFLLFIIQRIGRAVAQRLDAGFSPRRPGFAYGQHVGIVMDKAALGQVFSEYFGFPCQSFHQFLHHHNLPGLAQ